MTSPEAASALSRAEALAELSRFEEAAAVAAEALAADPDNARAHRVLASCLVASEKGDRRAVVEAARRAVALEPDNEHGHRLLSLGLRDSDPEGAVTSAKAAVRLAPQSWQTHYVLAQAYLSQGQFSLALDAARAAVALAPDQAPPHIALGRAAMSMRDHPTARAAFLQALRIDPANAAARNNLAVLDLRRRRWRAALVGFRSAVAADPRMDLARRNIDATAVAMLAFYRYLVVVSASLVVRPVAMSLSPVATGWTAGVALAVWAGLLAWGVTRVPPGSRRYTLTALRRHSWSVVIVAALAVLFGCVLLGPVLRVLPAGPAVTYGLVPALITLFADIVRGYRRRIRRRRAA